MNFGEQLMRSSYCNGFHDSSPPPYKVNLFTIWKKNFETTKITINSIFDLFSFIFECKRHGSQQFEKLPLHHVPQRPTTPMASGRVSGRSMRNQSARERNRPQQKPNWLPPLSYGAGATGYRQTSENLPLSRRQDSTHIHTFVFYLLFLFSPAICMYFCINL